ncbi:MAG TPA: TOPRIM nucleotidyl transferase/hydrolase domain-containing protein [Dehalococcoidia bacterium]|nr:TOPRIM nucleotidyl transferase/hydrolase domain-containing protein [Dehalococcoidia bacterium]
MEPEAVVLVEGMSDRLAVEALAKRRGRDLHSERVAVVPIGGAHAIGKLLEHYGPRGLGLRLAGLCDAGEESYVKRALERAGFGNELARAEMEALGFYVCEADLEDELVRALGADAVERIIEAEGESGRFETFRKQVEKRELSYQQQLHGFMWNRKIRYAPLLVAALDLTRVPRPLEAVLAHIS